jgi:hypothetical protein
MAGYEYSISTRAGEGKKRIFYHYLVKDRPGNQFHLNFAWERVEMNIPSPLHAGEGRKWIFHLYCVQERAGNEYSFSTLCGRWQEMNIQLSSRRSHEDNCQPPLCSREIGQEYCVLSSQTMRTQRFNLRSAETRKRIFLFFQGDQDMDIHSISIATPGIRKRKKILVSILWMRHSGFSTWFRGCQWKNIFT